MELTLILLLTILSAIALFIPIAKSSRIKISSPNLTTNEDLHQEYKSTIEQISHLDTDLAIDKIDESEYNVSLRELREQAAYILLKQETMPISEEGSSPPGLAELKGEIEKSISRIRHSKQREDVSTTCMDCNQTWIKLDTICPVCQGKLF